MSLDIGLVIPACEHCGRIESELFSHNYTHNVTPMWKKAGCYEALYESEGKLASDILPSLCAGLEKMLASPEEYRKLDPSNGWGNYEGAVSFLQRVVADFDYYSHKHPKAKVSVSR